MSTDQASYLLLYPNHGLNNYLVNDNHHTQNAIVPFFTERDQAPFQGLSESRDQPSTTELEHLLEAASPYPPINSWRNHLLTPIQGYEYGAENHQSSNTSGFDEIGTVWLQIDPNTQTFEPWINEPGAFTAQPLTTSSTDRIITQNSGRTADSVHGAVNDLLKIICNECNAQFVSKRALTDHNRESQHAPYACRCGVKFSRVDVLKRHLKAFDPSETFPCPYCSKYAGSNAFPRQDHLTQHLRGYHHIEEFSSGDDSQIPKREAKANRLSCPHEECSYHQPTDLDSMFPGLTLSPQNFKSQKHFTEHLREVHNESPYPCPELDCHRINGRGFFRKCDLLKHQREHH